MQILVHPKFVRELKHLPEDIQKILFEKEKVFRANPFHPRLKTHKLQGVLKGYWAFSITYHYRVIFEFVDANSVRFYMIGNHNIYEE